MFSNAKQEGWDRQVTSPLIQLPAGSNRVRSALIKFGTVCWIDAGFQWANDERNLHMPNVFTGFTIDSCKVGISLPAGESGNNVFQDVRITRTGTAVEQREAQVSAGDLMRLLGLPSDTPVQHLVDALRIAEEAKGKPRTEQIQALRSSSLVEWLGSTADIAAVAGVLLSAEARAYISASIGALFG